MAACYSDVVIACLLTFIVTSFISLGCFMVASRYLRLRKPQNNNITRLDSFPRFSHLARNTEPVINKTLDHIEPIMSTARCDPGTARPVRDTQSNITTLQNLFRSPCEESAPDNTNFDTNDGPSKATNISSYRKFATPPMTPLAPNLSLSPKQPCTPIKGPTIKNAEMFTFQRDSQGRPLSTPRIGISSKARTNRRKYSPEGAERRHQMPPRMGALMSPDRRNILATQPVTEPTPEPQSPLISTRDRNDTSLTVYTAPYDICRDCHRLSYSSAPERMVQIFHHIAAGMLDQSYMNFFNSLPKSQMLPPSKFEYIKCTNKNSQRDQNYQILLAWAKHFPKDATLEAVVMSLYQHYSSTDDVYKMYLQFCPNKSQV